MEIIGEKNDHLSRILEAKNITGQDIDQILNTFSVLVRKLKREEKERNKENTISNNQILSPNWIEVTSPSEETFFLNTKTGETRVEAPEMTLSELPFSSFKGQPSSLGIFQQMNPDFYEPLDESFKSAAFKKVDDIKTQSQNKVEDLVKKGILEELGVNKEEALVLFSYTYQAKPSKYSPYVIMNKVLAERNDNMLRTYRGYILHMLKALRKLEPVSSAGRLLYRGIDGKYLKFDKDHYEVGNEMTWPAFTSTSLKEDIIYDQFLNNASQPIIFEISGNYVGYNIKQFSIFPNEEEVLLEPETTFIIMSIQEDKRNTGAKRIKIKVQPRPLMISEAVENFGVADWNFRHPNQKKPYNVNKSRTHNQINQSTHYLQKQNNQTLNYQQQVNQNPLYNQGQTFYHQSYQDQILPLNWEERIDQKTGRKYYANTVTKKTQWDVPIQ